VDEQESIERVARKKLRTLRNEDAPTQKRRLYSFLARRGYDSDDIARTLRLVLDSALAQDADESIDA
jgi:SOS response regulatory protein OraA/RecX